MIYGAMPCPEDAGAAYIFDLDGTLLYTLEAIARAGNTVLRELGYPAQPAEDYRFYCGDGADTLTRRILDCVGDKDPEHYRWACMRNREELKRDPDYGVKPYEGMPETLRELKSRGIQLAVCSNKPHEASVAVIRRFFGGDLFSVIQGQIDGVPVKPDPAMANLVMKRLNITPEKCLYFGDTGTDMKTAKAAGIPAIGVLWGYRSREELVRNGADDLLDQPSGILNL